MTKLFGFSAFLFSTALSAGAFGADNPGQRFIDRLAGTESLAAVASPRVGDDAGDPAQSFLDRLAGKQAPASQPAGIAASGDPARDFVDRLAGVPASPAKADTKLADGNNSAPRLTSLESHILAR